MFWRALSAELESPADKTEASKAICGVGRTRGGSHKEQLKVRTFACDVRWKLSQLKSAFSWHSAGKLLQPSEDTGGSANESEEEDSTQTKSRRKGTATGQSTI